MATVGYITKWRGKKKRKEKKKPLIHNAHDALIFRHWVRVNLTHQPFIMYIFIELHIGH
jgi:hypothetical protein